MYIIEQLATSFVATAAFGIIFNAPKNSLIKCGLVGMFGWLIYIVMVNYSSDPVSATLTAAFMVAVISHMLARAYKTPVIVFSVAGMIPLVPGGLAYDAMRHLVENNYVQSLNLAAQTMLLSGAIAAGLLFSEAINQIVRKTRVRRNHQPFR